jgi:secondary thiamine-phosphate synthase enzyme
MLYNFKLETKHNDFVQLTDIIQKTVKESGAETGICVVYTPHTTAGLTVTSFWDPRGFEDIMDETNRLIPTRIDFKHQHDTPQDAAGHIKSSLIGVSLSFIITGGALLLGHSQGIFFMEFDGPRQREYFVKISADAK